MTSTTARRRAEPDRLAYWQALDSGRLLLMAAGVMLVAASLAGTAALVPRLNPAHEWVNWNAALTFGGLIAFGELLRLALPGGREAAPIAMVGAMSYALLLKVGGEH
ncbi:MAG: hypothetical protein J2P28_08765, partial [Actinobacteria bacterium]|nr:hypothetical protein [Actinomycetota bacterium]